MSSAEEKPWFAEDVYGVSGAGHKWAESGYDHASTLYLDANFEEAFKIDDVSSVFHYGSIVKLERLGFNMAGEHDDPSRVSNGLLSEDEVANLTLAVCFPKLSEDHNLDTANKIPELDFQFGDNELSFGNSRSAVNPPETSNEVFGVSEISIPPLKGLSTTCQMDDATGSKYIDDTLIEERTRLNRAEDRMSMNCSAVCKTHHTKKAIVENFMPSDKGNQVNQLIKAEDLSTNNLLTHNPLEENMVGPRQKRLCRRPKKYAEVLPVLKRKRGRPKKYCRSSSQGEALGVTSQKMLHATSLTTETLIKAEELSTNNLLTHSPLEENMVGSRQKRLCRRPKKYAEVLPVLKQRRVRPKKFCTSSSQGKALGVTSQKMLHATSPTTEILKLSRRNLETDSDDDYKPNVSHFKSKNDYNPWTLDEVVKLVDGIARFGQGQWTAIQSTFFTSSCRSPTNIRDKWRNLVKTNCGIKKTKIKDPILKKGILPNTLVERVRELAEAIPQCRPEEEETLLDSGCCQSSDPLLPE